MKRKELREFVKTSHKETSKSRGEYNHIALLKELKVKQQIKSNIVFISELNTYITPRNYARAFQRVVSKAGIRMCNVHTMRHAFATRLFEKGAAAKTISELLGDYSDAV